MNPQRLDAHPELQAAVKAAVLAEIVRSQEAVERATLNEFTRLAGVIGRLLA